MSAWTPITFGIFAGDDLDTIAAQFAGPADVEGATLIYASYLYEDYEGDALVIYRDRAGQLLYVTGGHCSCNGLEGCDWAPRALEDLTEFEGEPHAALVVFCGAQGGPEA